MYSFQIVVHASPGAIARMAPLVVNGRTLTPLDIQPMQLSTPLAISFEDACERLARLARMYCEPDGSFVWVADEPPQDERTTKAWQVDGNLIDGPSGLMIVELNGRCPVAEFDCLLRCFGWPECPLVFQLTREAMFLDEAELRRWIASF